MTSFKLKCIAAFTMALDHTGAALMTDSYLNGRYGAYLSAMRAAGRMAFLLFAFLTSEGLIHTKNIKKYLLRMMVFALISEIPFNLFYNLIYGRGLSVFAAKQNVLFTLTLGIISIMAYKKMAAAKGVLDKIFFSFTVIISVMAAELLSTDYGGFGVLLCLMLYVLRPKETGKSINRRAGQMIVLIVFSFIRYITSLSFFAGALCSVTAVWFYNGKEGKKFKWLFYVFYPAHMLVLVILFLIPEV